ncbi:response regulator transcription factor [Streptomyces sp. ISL-98]|uniref:response regulator transcription factor n=1 Tax=Streptomyces sp. ISL-98 TaxID=2819192 RepID=UPI0027E481B9|nr:response regulator transcription factor [Streptomyces sp. ISL-98]
MLEASDDITVVGQAADGSQVLEAVRVHRPDIVIIDIRMPNVDGVEATRRLVSLPRHPRVIILTAFALDEHLHEALNAGADGFILKDIAPRDLIAAVHTVAAGDALVSPSMTRRLIERYNSSTAVRATQAQVQLNALPRNHRHILALLAHGSSNAQIGAAVGLSESRVKAEVSQLMRELGVSNRVQAATLACTAGLLDQPLSHLPSPFPGGGPDESA